MLEGSSFYISKVRFTYIYFLIFIYHGNLVEKENATRSLESAIIILSQIFFFNKLYFNVMMAFKTILSSLGMRIIFLVEFAEKARLYIVGHVHAVGCFYFCMI